jgi:hypothetical protein
MSNRSRSRWVVSVILLLLVVVLLAGCWGREAEEEETTSLLPRITINIDDEGYPKLVGISLSTLGRLLRQDFSTLRVPPELLAQLQAADIQHVELVMTKGGLMIFVNGQPMPYLAGDKESLQNLGETIETLGLANANVIRWALDNVVARVGLPVAVKFPVTPGNAEIPLADLKALPVVDVEQTRSAAGAPPLILHADVAVDAAGRPTIAGFPLTQLQDGLNQAGIAADLSGAALSPELVATLTGANIQNLQVEIEPEGIYLCLDGNPLPAVAWDAERIENLIDLYGKLSPDDANLGALRFFLPYVQPADVELTLQLPKQPGASDAPTCQFISR